MKKEFKAIPNRSKRTFTITTETGSKYRTIPMIKEEFNDALYWTLNDWKQFLKTDEYYKISGWQKGSTRLIERGEKPVKGAKNIRVTRRQKPDVFGQKGTFKNFAKIGVLNKPQILDEVAAREIQIFLDNDRELYLKMKLPILKALQKKYSKGIYNIDSAAKIWQKYIEAGMVKYNKTFGNKYSKWFDLLSVSDRKLLALEYAKETLMEFNEGNFEF